MESEITFEEWLAVPILLEDTLPLPWKPDIRYVPIDVVKIKIAYMKEVFGVSTNYYDNHLYATIVAHEKDTLFTGNIRIELIKDGKLFASLAGSATFSKGQYTGNWQFGPIAKSLAIVNAFSSEYAQFGKGLNKENVLDQMIAPAGSNLFKTSSTVKNFQSKL